MNQQLALGIHLNDEATLADFDWGTNPLVNKHLNDLLTEVQHSYVYLWGASGVGKSHLLQACCQATKAPQSAIYLPLDKLFSWGTDILEGMEQHSLIAIDDIHIAAGARDWEEQLFHLYNRIKDSDNAKLLIAGDAPPASLSLQLPDLKSRLTNGLVLKVEELSDLDKVSTLIKIANKRGFALPESVARYLINHSERGMHNLMAAMDKLDKASLMAHRKLTIPFVKEVLNF